LQWLREVSHLNDETALKIVGELSNIRRELRAIREELARIRVK